MAGYRPKSLDELNSMYDQTRAADKAIRKGTSLLSSEEFSKPSEKELDAIKLKEKQLLDALENSYNFNTFLEKKTEEETNPIETEETPEKEEKAEIQLNQNEDVSPKKPVITQVVDPVITDTAEENIIVSPANEQSAAEQESQEITAEEEVEVSAEAEIEVKAEIEAEAEEAEVSVQPVEENEEKQEPAAVIIHQSDFVASTVRTDLIDDYKKIMNDEEDDEEEPVKEKKLSRKEKKKRKKQQAAEKAANESKEQNNQQTSETAENENTSLEPQSFAEAKEYNPVDSEPVFEEDVFKDLVTPSKESSFTVEETVEEHDDFDFPENYEPEWIENDKAEDLKEAEEKANKKKSQRKSGSTLAKSILVLLLAVVVFMAFVATTLKSVIAVNTGTPFRENYYAFTAYTDYETAGILEGDLIITEKVYAEDGDVFAYINYNEKTFEFAKRTRSILNNDEVLIVAVNGDERTLISRDDCRGVVYATYSGIGKYVALITDNYIIVMAVLVVIALVACLALIFGFKSNKKSNKKKDSEKPVTLTVTDEEDVNLFETIG